MVDANYQHALCWYRAFREHDVVLPVWRLHRHVGMGGDRFVEAVAGRRVEGARRRRARADLERTPLA